nr:hypothetical protein CFP56_21216 [Quercus suber]
MRCWCDVKDDSVSSFQRTKAKRAHQRVETDLTLIMFDADFFRRHTSNLLAAASCRSARLDEPDHRRCSSDTRSGGQGSHTRPRRPRHLPFPLSGGMSTNGQGRNTCALAPRKPIGRVDEQKTRRNAGLSAASTRDGTAMKNVDHADGSSLVGEVGRKDPFAGLSVRPSWSVPVSLEPSQLLTSRVQSRSGVSYSLCPLCIRC